MRLAPLNRNASPDFAELLLLQHVLEAIEQDIAGDDAAAALLQRHAQCVAGLSGGVEDIGAGQQRLVVLESLDIPLPLARIVGAGARDLPTSIRLSERYRVTGAAFAVRAITTSRKAASSSAFRLARKPGFARSITSISRKEPSSYPI